LPITVAGCPKGAGIKVVKYTPFETACLTLQIVTF